MSTTTDGSLPLRATRFIAAAFGVIAIWFVGLAIITVLFEPDANVTVFGPEHTRTAAVGSTNVKLLASGSGYITVLGERAGFVRALYANGAWLVLPGVGRGCGFLAVPRQQIARAS